MKINGKKYDSGYKWPIVESCFKTQKLSDDKIIITVGLMIPKVGEKDLVEIFMGTTRSLKNGTSMEHEVELAKNWIKRRLARALSVGVADYLDTSKNIQIDVSRLDEIAYFIHEVKPE